MKDRGSQRVRGAHRGWYILEASLVMFGVAAFVLGAADIARIFHARSAVRQGVTDGLRCLYPTAENCAATIPGNPTFTFPLFRSFVQTQAGFQYPRSDYRLSSDWFEEPFLAARKINKSLESIDILYGRSPYQVYDVEFPVDAHAMYLVQTRGMPKVMLDPNSALTPQQRVLRAQFRDRVTGSGLAGRPPGHQVHSLSSVKGTSRSGSSKLIGEVQFNLGDAWPTRDRDIAKIAALRSSLGFRGSIPCYQGAWRQEPSGPVIEWPNDSAPETCRYQKQAASLFDGTDLLVPIMVRISGDRYNTTAGSRGAVSAELEFVRDGRVQTFPLGGRIFQANTTDANFVIRGVGQGVDAEDSYFSVCKDEAGYEECEKYAALPVIPRGSQVSLKFYLQRTEGSGSVGWAGDWLQIFYPQFSLGQEERGCGKSTTPHVCHESVAPMLPLVTHTNISSGITAAKVPDSTYSCLRLPPQGSYPSKDAALAALQQDFEVGRRVLAPTQFESKESAQEALCQPVHRSVQRCSDAGVTDYAGCLIPPEYSPEQLLTKCRILDFDPTRDEITNIRFKDRLLSEEEKRAACSGPNFPECAQTSLVAIDTQFLTDAASVGCGYAIRRIGPVLAAGPLYDLLQKPSCPDIVEELKREYRKKHPTVPPQVSVDAMVEPAQPEGAAAPPGNPCQKYETGGVGEEVLCASGVAHYVAEQCCAERGGACRVENVSAGGSAGNQAVWQGRVALAALRAEETVRAAYPRAQSVGSAQCAPDASRCLQIQGATLDNATRVQLSASMQVPLALLGWLGLQDMVTVQYSETRTLEAALVGSSG